MNTLYSLIYSTHNGDDAPQKTNSSAKYSMINRLSSDILRALSQTTLHWILYTDRLHYQSDYL